MRRPLRGLLSALAALLLLVVLPARAGVDVRVRGLGADERDNAYAQLSILEYAKRVDAEKGEYDSADIERLFRQGEGEIARALQPFGWYSPTVTMKLAGAKPDWVATYTVVAGPLTAVESIDVQLTGEGAEVESLRALAAHPRPLHLHERLKHEEYEELKTRLVQAAYAAGLLDAQLTRRELRVDVPNHSAAVLITLDTGRRYRFGDISIEQDGAPLREDFLRRYIGFQPGDYYDPAKVLATQFAFGDLDYFESVDVEPQRDQVDADGRLPMRIRTTEKAPRVYKYGLGYGTDTGPRASVGAQFRRLNDSGHKLNLDLRISPVISTAIAEYRIPWGRVPSDSVSFTTQTLKQDFKDVRETLYRVGASINRQGKVWQRRAYIEYTVDDYSLSGQSPHLSNLLVPGISVTRTEADDPIFPKSGWYLFADVHGGSTAALSDTNFIQGLVKLRSTIYLGNRLYLVTRGDEGMTLVGSFNNLPPSQRFFAGGDDSVRGYAYQAIGPRNAAGTNVGGKFLTTLSTELNWYPYKTYGIAAFVDSGGSDDALLVSQHLGAGMGLRYRAPFGAFALDLAHPFDRNLSPVRLHLGVRVGL